MLRSKLHLNLALIALTFVGAISIGLVAYWLLQPPQEIIRISRGYGHSHTEHLPSSRHSYHHTA